MLLQVTEENPTLQQFSSYQEVFNIFNKELFNGQCEPCFLNFSRASKSLGFFRWNAWTNNERILHEISLNPDNLDRGIAEALSTLVHEMAHLLRHQIKGSSTPYHDQEWVNLMLEVGLKPYSYDMERKGRDPYIGTGTCVTHEIIPDGRFMQVLNKIPKDILLPWKNYTYVQTIVDTPTIEPKLEGKFGDDGEIKIEPKPIAPKKKKAHAKAKHTFKCPECNAQVWGKLTSRVLCEICTQWEGVEHPRAVRMELVIPEQ